MKRQFKIYITLGISPIGSILFYKEGIGINVLLFSIIALISVFTIVDISRLKNLIPIILSLVICSVILLLYPQKITLIIWMISYLSLWTLAFYDLRPILVPIQAIGSMFVTPFVALMNLNLTSDRTKHLTTVEESEASKNNFKIHSKVYLFSTLIVTFFILLYTKANPLVANLILKIDLSFIDFGFIAIVFLLFVIHFGFIFFAYFKNIEILNQTNDHISKKELKEKDFQQFVIARWSIAIITGLLFLINIFDIYALTSGELPEGLTYSAYVHQGFYTLIFSMSLAIALILYFLRDQLYFHQKITHLKQVMFLWVVQNVVLILITFYKNYLYVHAYGLTYKRIAVFLCLTCMGIGFVVAISKIRKPLSNWYFFNHTAMLAYFSFVGIAVLPYDILITRYNLGHSETKDITYVLSLKHPDYSYIGNYMEDAQLKDISSVNNEKTSLDFKWDRKQNEFFESLENKSWKSWNYYHKYVQLK